MAKNIVSSNNSSNLIQNLNTISPVFTRGTSENLGFKPMVGQPNVEVKQNPNQTSHRRSHRMGGAV